MKKTTERFISTLLVLLMAFSTVSLSFSAFAAENEETVETIVMSNVMSVEAYEVDATSEDEIECEVEEFVESDETSAELSADEVVESMNLTNGISDLEMGLIEDKVQNPVDSGDDVAVVNEPLEENMDSLFEVQGDSNSGIETNFAVISFKADPNKLTIDQGATAKVTISYLGTYLNVKVGGEKSNDNVSAQFTNSRPFKIDLLIKGDKVGSSKITVKLYSSSGKLLKSLTINITVRQSNYISVEKTRIDIPSGKSAELNVTFHGANIIRSTGSSGAGCQYSLTNNKLKITGTNVGTTKISLYLKNKSGRVLDTKVITVNVSKNSTITPSKSSVTVDIGDNSTISFSLKNVYGSPCYSTSLSNSNCVTSWSGSSLKITGKTAGTTNVTVKVYDSRGNYLASTTIKVTVRRNPKLTPNVSTVNLIPAQKAKVNIKLTGYDGGVYAKYSNSNSSICGLSWSANWSNNSLTMTAYGYKQGTAKITVYLYSSSGQKLTETSVTVKVTGVPSIKVDSSFNVNMGAQKSFLISVSNIASNYKLSLTKSGSSFTGTFDKSGNNIYCNIKGTTEGSGSVFVTLKSEDGTVLATKTIPVKILWVENPQITVSNTNPTIMEGKTGSVTINCTGTKKQFIINGTYSRYKNEPQASVNLTTSSKSNAILSASCSKPTIARIKLEMVEKSTGKVLATKTVTFDIIANTDEFNNLTYGRKNYSTDIPLSTFRYMYDYEGRSTPSTLARTMYEKHHVAGGVCFGFATTSMLFNSGTVSTRAFGASSIKAINDVEKFINPTLNISAKRFIESMYIMQFAQGCKLNKGISDMCNLIKSGNKVLVAIFDNGSGHALIGYKFDEARNRIYVCDNNTTTDSSRYIQLETNIFGAYSGWSYKPLGWSGGTGKIKYQTLSNIRSLWNNRANIHYDDSLETMVKSMDNVFFTNSSDFNICDVEGNVLATFSNGELVSNSEDIYMVEQMSYLEDPDYPQESINADINMFYLPRAFYVVDNKDDAIDSFEAQMVNYDYGVSVSTEADQVAFGVDDTADLCTSSVLLKKGESYEITLLSSKEGEGDVKVEGQATAESVELGFALVEGQLTETNSDGATVNLNGVADNYVEIEATATEGGSITPEGASNVVVGSDLSYSITPDEGYYIAEVLVNGEYVGAIEDYTFSSVNENSTIEARFEKFDLTTTGVDVKKNGYNSISWQPTKASNGYEIYRKYADGEWEMIADVESDVLDYVDKEVSSKFYKYAYSVKAYMISENQKIYGAFDEIGYKNTSLDITMEISNTPNKTVYYEGDILDTTGLEIKISYADGTYETFNSEFECDISKLTQIGQQTISVVFDGFDSTFTVTVNPIYYKVNWIVGNDTYTDTVKIGDPIVQPDEPQKSGYIFIGWDSDIPDVMLEKDLVFIAEFELIIKQLKIKNPSVTTINYGETLVMHADFGGVELPEGWKIEWTVEGAGFNMAPAADGLTCKMTSVANGNATVKATLVDENGEAVLDAEGNEMSDSKQLTSKAGFWQKFISFFKNLFGISRIILQTI